MPLVLYSYWVKVRTKLQWGSFDIALIRTHSTAVSDLPLL